MAQIEVTKLSKVFQENTEFEKIALDNVSLKIKKGEFVAIVGRNGSGKSTLMSVITGVEKPTDGKVAISERFLFTRKTKFKHLKGISDEIGMSFQNPNLQIFRSTVLKDVAFSLENRGIEKVQAKEQSAALLEKLDFDPELFERSPFQLSAGQKRKLILASLLISNPNILVFDEPTANLDEESSAIFMDMIKKLNKDEKKTIIFISHNIDIVKTYAKRLIRLEKGKVIFDGKIEEGDI